MSCQTFQQIRSDTIDLLCNYQNLLFRLYQGELKDPFAIKSQLDLFHHLFEPETINNLSEYSQKDLPAGIKAEVIQTRRLLGEYGFFYYDSVVGILLSALVKHQWDDRVEGSPS